jgi:GTP cyclohydrolase I
VLVLRWGANAEEARHYPEQGDQEKSPQQEMVIVRDIHIASLFEHHLPAEEWHRVTVLIESTSTILFTTDHEG